MNLVEAGELGRGDCFFWFWLRLLHFTKAKFGDDDDDDDDELR